MRTKINLSIEIKFGNFIIEFTIDIVIEFSIDFLSNSIISFSNQVGSQFCN